MSHTSVCALRIIVCILGLLHCYDNLSIKWSTMMTTPHLSTNNSKTKVLSSLKAYPSEGVPNLNMAGQVEAPKLLYSSLQSHKVQETKMANFWQFSWPACTLKTAQLAKGGCHGAPIQWLCPCLLFVVVPLTQFKVESHKVFSHCFVLTKTEDLAKMVKNESKFVWSRY